jgi:hypothetical protein
MTEDFNNHVIQRPEDSQLHALVANVIQAASDYLDQWRGVADFEKPEFKSHEHKKAHAHLIDRIEALRAASVDRVVYDAITVGLKG